jgi:Sugar (pentulose and hexulose) kinases
MPNNLYLGIDIGTTTVCAAVSDGKKLIEAITLPNNSFINSSNAWEHIQDPNVILASVVSLITKVFYKYSICGIGICGQMHGILYLDSIGDPVSPLYTWQDERSSLDFGGESITQRFARLTRCSAYSGYGLVTHYYNLLYGLVPDNTTALCTIQDFICKKLCGLTLPHMHTGDAASLGAFDLAALDFDRTALNAVGITESILPVVHNNYDIIGEYIGIPVRVAAGDNQASFIGAVEKPTESVLVNIGTGGQFSMLSNYVPVPKGTELRPLCGDRYLLTGSSLCGGRAYSMLADFFCSVFELAGIGTPENIYQYMDLAAGSNKNKPLEVSTLFCGTRADPTLRGEIKRIGNDNFTAAAFIDGINDGMARELYNFYISVGKPEFKYFIGSGNALRKNAGLRIAIEKLFGRPLSLSPYCEEAAFGASLIAAGAI